MLNKIKCLLHKIRESKKGATAVYMALTMPVFLGFSGLAFDGSMWFMERRILQNTVDAATLSAAYSKFNDGTSTEMLADATSSAADNFFTVGGSNTLVVNSPPTSGAFSGQGSYVQATISTPAQGFFSSAFGIPAPTIVTTATAGVIVSGNGCLMALSEDADSAIDLTGNATVNINCAITSNSDSDESIVYGGSVTISAEPAMIADGDINNTGNGYDLDPETELRPDSGDTEDPHSDLEIPTNSNIPDIETCQVTFGGSGPSGINSMADAEAASAAVSVSGGTYTMQPGRYCGTIPFSNSDVVLSPGTYIIEAGDFDVGSNGTLTGNGVTIILTADDPADIGNVDINGTTVVTLTGQTPDQLAANSTDTASGTPPVIMGEYAGVLLYQDRRAPPASPPNQNVINGNAANFLNGAFYFPTYSI